MRLAQDYGQRLLSCERDSGRLLESLVSCQAAPLVLFLLLYQLVELSATPGMNLDAVSDM